MEDDEPKDAAETVSTGSVYSAPSGLSFAEKMRIPLAASVTTFHIGAKVYVPVVYATSFGGDAGIIGAGTLLLMLYGFYLQIICGSLSDNGWFNKGFFHDLSRWGRRAPLGLYSLPFCMIGSVLVWSSPTADAIRGFGQSIGVKPMVSLGSIVVSLWYFFAVLIVETGTCMSNVAKMAAWSELFPSQKERQDLAPYVFVAQVIGILLGGTVVGTTSLSVESIESPSRRSLVYALFAIACAAAWLLAIPYKLMMTRSQRRKTVGDSVTIWRLKEALISSPPLRWICLASHCQSGALLLFGTILPFFIVDVIGMSSDVVADKTRLVMIGVVSVIFVGLPFTVMVVRRVGSLQCCQIGGVLACCFHSLCHFTTMTMESNHMLVMIAFCGLSYGLMEICWGVCLREYLPLVVDDDFVAGKAQGRRDGLFAAARLNASILGNVWTGLFTLVLGLVGYSSEKYNAGVAQSAAVKAYVVFAFNVVVPALYFTFACACFMFPLQGERLAMLKVTHANMMSKGAAKTDSSSERTDPTTYGLPQSSTSDGTTGDDGSTGNASKAKAPKPKDAKTEEPDQGSDGVGDSPVGLQSVSLVMSDPPPPGPMII